MFETRLNPELTKLAKSGQKKHTKNSSDTTWPCADLSCFNAFAVSGTSSTSSGCLRAWDAEPTR